MMPRPRPDDPFNGFTYGFALVNELGSPPNPRQSTPLERVAMLSHTMLGSTLCVVQPVTAGKEL